MLQEGAGRHPIFCILPPHVLRTIAENGTPQQRHSALRTLATDNTLRALRAGPRLPVPLPQRPGILMVEGQKQRTIFDAQHSQNLPGQAVRAEGALPTGDPAVDEAYDGLGACLFNLLLVRVIICA